MRHFGIIGGSNLFHSRFFKGLERNRIETLYGIVDVFEDTRGELIFIPRHGIETRLPPHKINHLANISALKSKGVRYVLGISSVGSLKIEIPPGTYIIPEDFIQLSGIPTFYNFRSKHITPGLNKEMRKEIERVGKLNGFPVRAGGVYIQTIGPRFETAAEIRFFSSFGDMVGMNMASEATLAKEMELEYASLSVVDNYANGVSGEITYDEFMELVKAHQETLDRFLEILVPALQKKYK